MLIKDSKKTTKLFGRTYIGDVFRAKGSIYMTMEETRNICGDDVNAVCLEDGRVDYFDDNEMVEPLITELIICS